MDEKDLQKLISDIKAGFDTTSTNYKDMDRKLTQVEAYAKELDGKIKLSDAELKAIAIRLQAPPEGGETKGKGSPLHQKYMTFLQSGKIDEETMNMLKAPFTPDMLKTMSVGDDTTGGVMVETEVQEGINKTVLEYSPIDEIAFVRTSTTPSVKVRKKTSTTGAALYVSELGTRADTGSPRYGADVIPTHECYAMIDVSRQDLQDVKFLENEINLDVGEQFGVRRGLSFVTGDKVGKPEGLLSNTSVTSYNAGSTTVIQAKTLRKMTFQLKEPYHRNAKWLMKRTTLGELAAMTDANGKWLFPELQQPYNGQFNLLGYPVVPCTDMQAISSALCPIAFGDFYKGYEVVNYGARVSIRDPYSVAASAGAVRFHWFEQHGGQVIQPEAMIKYIMSA